MVSCGSSVLHHDFKKVPSWPTIHLCNDIVNSVPAINFHNSANFRETFPLVGFQTTSGMVFPTNSIFWAIFVDVAVPSFPDLHYSRIDEKSLRSIRVQKSCLRQSLSGNPNRCHSNRCRCWRVWRFEPPPPSSYLLWKPKKSRGIRQRHHDMSTSSVEPSSTKPMRRVRSLPGHGQNYSGGNHFHSWPERYHVFQFSIGSHTRHSSFILIEACGHITILLLPIQKWKYQRVVLDSWRLLE